MQEDILKEIELGFSNNSQILINDMKFKSKLATKSKSIFNIGKYFETGFNCVNASCGLFFLSALAGAPPIMLLVAPLTGIGSVIGFKKINKKIDQKRMYTFPKFLNGSLNFTAFNISCILLYPAVRIAFADGNINEYETDRVMEYFDDEWGYNREFISSLMSSFISRIDSFNHTDYKETLLAICRESKDTEYEDLVKAVESVMQEVMMADSYVNKLESEEYDRFMSVLHPPSKTRQVLDKTTAAVTGVTVGTFQAISDAGKDAADVLTVGSKTIAQGASSVSRRIKENTTEAITGIANGTLHAISDAGKGTLDFVSESGRQVAKQTSSISESIKENTKDLKKNILNKCGAGYKKLKDCVRDKD